jgi:NhaP-type Na+/H+ or K+/H+ antiporter
MIETVSALLPLKLALILGAGIGAQWLAWRLQWPAVVLLSLAGLVLGPGSALLLGQPLIDPAADFGALLRPAIALAVAVILFEGGLNLNFADLRDAGSGVRRLIFPGAPVAMILGAAAAHYVAGLAWDIAFLFGGLMIVTGPTVIVPLLRQARLSGRAGALLRWEGIINDPIGAILAVFVFEVIRTLAAGGGWADAAMALLFGVAVGGLLGLGAGIGLAWAFRRGHVPEFLKAPVVLAAVMGVFVTADAVAHETGLLAVTVFGMTMANLRLASIEEMRRFKESIAIILVSGVFVVLTASLTPETIGSIDLKMIAFVLAMMFVVRPVSVFLSTLGAGLPWRERLLVGWIAPRGVVAITVAGYFAVELVAIGRLDGAALAPLALLMVLGTVFAHGFTITPLARRLRLAKGTADGVLIVGGSAWSAGLAAALRDMDAPVTLADSSYRRLRPARDAGVSAFIGEVLSEQAAHRLDHAGIGHLVAAGPNEAYNALVCVHFAPELGRHRVWQLGGDDAQDSKVIARTSRGGALIRTGRSFESLAHDWWSGWRFRATKLTETYALEDLKRDRPESDLVAERRPDGGFSFLGAGVQPKGAPGSVILTFGPPRAEAGAPEQNSEPGPAAA